MTADTIRHDGTYRRGVILGLTMAEIMILVVFCLMALLAVTLAEKDELENAPTNLASNLLNQVRQQYPDTKLQYDDFAERLTDDWEKAKKYDSLVATLENIPPDKVEDVIAAGATIYSRANEEQRRNLLALAKALPVEGTEADTGLPPLIDLRDEADKFFEVGSAQVSEDFRHHLREVIAPLIWKNLQEHPDVDVIEIVGHTSETAMGNRRGSNIDAVGLGVVAGREPASKLSAGDNAGLGLARAIAVMRVLKEDERFRDVTMLPLSAGQLIQPVDVLADGTMSGEVTQRRRIEIRARRKSVTAVAQ